MTVAAFLQLVSWGVRVQAQTNSEIQAGIQFNSSVPGARGLGMGGAFVGLSDDATAAYANPAGIMILQRPELWLESRHWSYTSSFTDRGHDPGQPTRQGVDTISGLRSGESRSDRSGPSYAAFVYPRRRWAVAGYRHQLADFAGTLESHGPFSECFATCSPPQTFRAFPARAGIAIEIVNAGAAAALRIGDNLFLGMGVSLADFSLDSRTRRYHNDPNDFFGQADFSTGNVVNRQIQRGRDRDLTGSLGFIWRIGGRWSVAGVFRRGPVFRFEAVNQGGPAGSTPGRIFARQTARFHVPDAAALGVAWRPIERLTVTTEATRVLYSQMVAEMTNVFGAGQTNLSSQTDQYKVDNALELHAGAEYVLGGAGLHAALRIGAWLDPDHRIRFEGRDEFSQLDFRGGAPEIHYTLGAGLVLRSHLKLDVALDVSELTDVASLAVGTSF